MRDSYVGDVGDYAKFGLSRAFTAEKKTLAINWYYTPDLRDSGMEGKFIGYLRDQKFSEYDSELFKILTKSTLEKGERNIKSLEKLKIGAKIFHGDPVPGGGTKRKLWHQRALEATNDAEIVFLDPDNGLASEKMTQNNIFSVKHALWNEINDYYQRGQSVLLYQHRPRAKSREALIDDIRDFNKAFLKADALFYGDFSRCQNRYILFLLP